MMNDYINYIAMALIITFAIGMIRVVIGPSIVDRLLGIQLIGTTGIGLLMVFSKSGNDVGYLDTALVLALLAPITTLAFIKVLDGLEGSSKQ